MLMSYPTKIEVNTKYQYKEQSTLNYSPALTLKIGVFY